MWVVWEDDVVMVLRRMLREFWEVGLEWFLASMLERILTVLEGSLLGSLCGRMLLGETIGREVVGKRLSGVCQEFVGSFLGIVGEDVVGRTLFCVNVVYPFRFHFRALLSFSCSRMCS